MRPGFIATAAVIATGFIISIGAAQARGVCSTGAYKTCVACCKSNPTITNRELCTYQCGEYKIRERQEKAGQR